FLNDNVFGAMGRASGSVFDANIAGAIAALWTGAFVLWGQRFGRWRALFITGGVAAAWLTVWASGSRTAFASAAVVALFGAVTFYASFRSRGPRTALLRLLVPVAAVIAIGI